MEERNEVLEFLVDRWNGYRKNLAFYEKVEDTFTCAERYINKYSELLTELTHIIARVMQQGYAETYNMLNRNLKTNLQLKIAQQTI